MPPPLSLLIEPTRLEILRLVWTRELSAGQIARQFATTFGAVSQHLRRLLDAGAVQRRRDGRMLYYSANRAALGPLAAALEALWTAQLGTLKQLAEAEQRRIDDLRAAASGDQVVSAGPAPPRRSAQRKHFKNRKDKS